MSASGGVCSGGCLLRGSGCLLRGGVCSQGQIGSAGVSAPGGCLVWWGLVRVSCPGGLPQRLLGYHLPPCEQNDKQVQKYYLGHNFVAAGNYSWGLLSDASWQQLQAAHVELI